MKKLIALAALLLASVGLYIAVFANLDRPLTQGAIAEAIRSKADYANALAHPKLAIWAGSNGRYSHRCEAFTAVAQMPCVNLSLAVGIGIDVQLLYFEPLLKRGDVLYMPLEYSQYLVERGEMESGAENSYLVHHARDLLSTLEPQRIARAWGSFDLPFLVHGLIETALSRTGFQRRGGKETMTKQGDHSGHTVEAGEIYKPFLSAARFDTRPMPHHSYAIEVIEAFLERARASGVVVVGGLPTTPDTVVLDTADIAQLKSLFTRHGHRFLLLPNRSQYPLSCFFDTLYHLNQACQIQHSLTVGRALAAELTASVAAPAGTVGVVAPGVRH